MPGLLFQPLLRHGNHAMRQGPTKGHLVVQQDMERLILDSALKLFQVASLLHSPFIPYLSIISYRHMLANLTNTCFVLL